MDPFVVGPVSDFNRKKLFDNPKKIFSINLNFEQNFCWNNFWDRQDSRPFICFVFVNKN